MVVVVVATIVALAWMCYRASSLLGIPVPTLVKLLGLDLPAPPRVSLHGIAADTITLHWSLPEKAGSVAKHIIQINGINVGESEKRGETSVTVTGLNPDHLYNVRVIAANSNNFQAPGQLIRLRTRRKSQVSNDPANGHLVKPSDSSDDAPSIHSHVPVLEPPSPQQHHQAQHHNNHRRTAKDRRGSPATLEQRNQTHQRVSSENQHTVQSLTAKLEAVRREIDDTEAQLTHVEEEFKAAEVVLRTELDELKAKKDEEDAGRQKLRSETRALEENKRVAEAKRSKTEKSLRAKQDEIRKMQEDQFRWDEERTAALERVEELSREANESKENAINTERELSDDMKEAQNSIWEMEEEIRTLAASMKTLEGQREQWKAEENAEGRKLVQDEENEKIWKERQRNLEMRYVAIYNSFQASEIEYSKSSEALMHYQNRRGSDSMPQKKNKQRRNRNRKSRTQAVSSPINSYPLHDHRFPEASTFNNMHLQQISPTFSSSVPSSPFFNIANGTVSALAEHSDTSPGVSRSMDMDKLTGGGPMSPTANSLLPSNLFAFEDIPPSPKLDESQMRNSNFDPLTYITPHSPMSSDSTSHISSPRSSLHHMPIFQSDQNTDSDRASSISAIGSHRHHGETVMSGSRRFVSLFTNSFNRQRGKTLPIDSPLIGSLKPHESNSFPKSPDPPGLDPIGTRRRSGSYGSWNSNSNIEPSASNRPNRGLERADSTSSRRSAFNPFSPSFDPIEPRKLFETPHSPRPSSIASFDNNFLPAPSSNVSAAFGWPASDHHPHNHHPEFPPPRSRVGLLVNDWPDFTTNPTTTTTNRSSRSRPASRPISPNANSSTTSLSLYPSHQQHQNQHQQLTSSPSSFYSLRPTTPRGTGGLNPTAPTFETFSHLSHHNRHHHHQHHHSAESNSLTSTSNLSTLSLPLSLPLSTNNSNPNPNPTKDSLLSRISALSRKGSTGKFNISKAWGKDGGGFFSRGRKADEVFCEEEEEGGGGGRFSSPISTTTAASTAIGTGILSGSRNDTIGTPEIILGVGTQPLWKEKTFFGRRTHPIITTTTNTSVTPTPTTTTPATSTPTPGRGDTEETQSATTTTTTTTTTTPLMKLSESSPWTKNPQNGFFGTIGRKKGGGGGGGDDVSSSFSFSSSSFSASSSSASSSAAVVVASAAAAAAAAAGAGVAGVGAEEGRKEGLGIFGRRRDGGGGGGGGEREKEREREY